jgi:peroxiredoxin
VKLVSDTLQKYYPGSRAVKALWADRNRLFAEYNRVKFSLSAKNLPVQLYPDIKLPDKNGDTIRLQNIKGKLVLLNFWTPLNQDCQVALHSFKELYEKYSPKGFEIYNVALFDDAGYWSNFVSSSEIAGFNVFDQLAGNSIYAKIYNVQKLPATFLLNKKDGIVAKDIYGNNLEKLIKKNLQ